MAGLLANITLLSILLLAIGLLLMIVELCIPGFGICGTLSIACLIGAVVITAKTVVQGLIMAAGIALILAVMFIIFLILASQGIVPKKLVLKASTDDKSGFSGASVGQELVGAQGVAITPLRPAGVIEYEGRRLDVVTDGGFIEAGARVRVTEVDGNRVVVIAE